MTNEIVVLCGFSAVGKDSVAEQLRRCGYNFVVSTTTRPMREYEEQMMPYHFVDDEDFQILVKQNDLIEHRKYNTCVNGVDATWHYGVTKGAIKDDKPYVVVLDILGLKDFKDNFGDRITSFFLDVDDETRKQRCIKRDGNKFCEQEWSRRLADDRENFSKEVVANEVDHVIDSYNVVLTTNEILKILGE